MVHNATNGTKATSVWRLRMIRWYGRLQKAMPVLRIQKDTMVWKATKGYNGTKGYGRL